MTTVGQLECMRKHEWTDAEHGFHTHTHTQSNGKSGPAEQQTITSHPLSLAPFCHCSFASIAANPYLKPQTTFYVLHKHETTAFYVHHFLFC